MNLERTPGGSSGGGATAVVAARVTPVAYASVGAGSIRIPASWCGPLGLKTTRGRIPPPGINQLGIHAAQERGVTRTARDTAGAPNWMARSAPGHSAIPIRSPDGPYLDAIVTPPHRLRIALSTGDRGHSRPPDRQIVERVTAAAGTLEELGQIVEPVPDTDIADSDLFWDTFTLGFGWAGGTTIGGQAEELDMRTRASTFSPVIADLVRRSETISGADIGGRLKRNQAHSLRVARLFERYDVLVTGRPQPGLPRREGPSPSCPTRTHGPGPTACGTRAGTRPWPTRSGSPASPCPRGSKRTASPSACRSTRHGEPKTCSSRRHDRSRRRDPTGSTLDHRSVSVPDRSTERRRR